MKVVQYFKHARNLNAYKKKYKNLTHALLCVFVLCAAFVLTTHAGAETQNLENYTYVSYSQSSDLDDEETLQLLTIDESTHPVYVLTDSNISSVKVSTDKNSDGVENGTITPDTKYLKLKVEFKGIHADTLETQYGGSFAYNLPEFFRSTSTTERPIINDNNKVIGKIHVENGKAIVTYTKEFLESLGEHATLSGNFFLEGEVYLSTLDKDNGSIEATFPNGSIKLEYGPSFIEKYSDVKVDKAYTKDPNSDYIKYTLTVSAGPDGSQNVYVVDKFTTNKNLVTYAGNISHTPTELGTTEDGQKLYETRSTEVTGKIYLTNQPASDKEVPDPVTGNTNITQPGSIVWSIDQLTPNETRTLTYYVKLTDKQDIRNKNITNKASVLNKKDDETYLKGSSEKTFTPSVTYGMTKNIISTNGQKYTKDAEGNYIVQYKLNLTLNATSNYPLKNIRFLDYLNNKPFSTDDKMLPYISYDRSSLELHYVKGSSDTIVDSSLYKVEWETDGTNYKENWTDGNPKRFKVSGTENHPIIIYPGETYYVTYKLKIKPEVYATMQSGQVEVQNLYISDSDNAKKSNSITDRLDRLNNKLNLSDYTWIHKVKDDNVTTNDQTIQMNSEVYVKKNNTYVKDSSVSSFTVPKGSYKYTVNLNKSQNQFDITHATLKDALSSDIMHYVGYVKITAYEYDANTNTYKDKESKWVKIDKQTSFELKLSELGWSNSYGYRFDYYAQTQDLSEVGQIKVTNTFTLNGDVVKGDQKFNFTNKTASQTTQFNGFYNLNAGDSTTTTDNPHLTIKKIDQDNANPMSGVTFDIYECKLNGDKIQRVEGSTISGETENGLYAVKAPFVTYYNTIYEVKERNTPDGYIKDDSSYYIICVDKENSEDYSDYVKQCIAYFETQSNKKYKIAYSTKDFNLTIYNSQTGIVVKKAFMNNAAGTSHKPVSGTYTFGLYDNSQGSGSPLQVKTITYSTGEKEEKTTKFINLNLDTTYYVFELDDEGNPITDTSQEVKVNKLPYVVDYKVKGKSTSKAVVGDLVIVTNSLRTKKLPSAGSRLTLIYRQLGLAMLGTSFIVLLIVYKNRGKDIKEEIGK